MRVIVKALALLIIIAVVGAGGGILLLSGIASAHRTRSSRIGRHSARNFDTENSWNT